MAIWWPSDCLARCLVKSPLLIGADLANVSQRSLDLLKNPELIAISQVISAASPDNPTSSLLVPYEPRARLTNPELAISQDELAEQGCLVRLPIASSCFWLLLAASSCF